MFVYGYTPKMSASLTCLFGELCVCTGTRREMNGCHGGLASSRVQ